ncbi:MAG: MarP family serine protease [Actinomycetes bacterium]
MNTLDLTVLAMATLASIVGASVGLLRSLTAWVGAVLGGAIGVALLPTVAERVVDGSDAATLLGPVVTVLGASALGALLGTLAGSALRAGPAGRRPGRLDRLAGSAVGAFAVVVLAWILLPLAAASRGWPDELTRSSAVARSLDRHGPALPGPVVDAVRALAVGRPSPGTPVVPTSEVGPPPSTTVLRPSVAVRAAGATVRIEGRACSLLQDGTGVAIGADLVVTAAHVVAGEDRTAVIRPDGSSLLATVVAFDGDRDVAVLRVPGLGLPFLRTGRARIGDLVGIPGHPQGGPLRIADARIAERITATGRDIYDRQDTRRDVYVLAAALAPGDSGAGLVSTDGLLVGLAFAVDPDSATTAYALTDAEIDPVLRRAGSLPVSTGGCAVR